MDSNFVTIPIDLLTDEPLNDKTFSKIQAYIDILSMADENGEIQTSERILMKRWGWGNTRVRNFINYLIENNVCKVSDKAKTKHQTKHPTKQLNGTQMLVNTELLKNAPWKNKAPDKAPCKASDEEGARQEKSNIKAEELFEKIWKLYPVKKGKGKISNTQKNKLLKIGYDEMVRAIERYKKYVKSIDYLSYQNGSTFFNSGYVDYLDKNYEASDEINKPKNQFNDFKQNDYNFDELEEELLRNGGSENER